MIFPYIPTEVLHIILEYYGKIKYENGKYINIISKYDKRCKKLKLLINKKIEIMKQIHIHDKFRSSNSGYESNSSDESDSSDYDSYFYNYFFSEKYEKKLLETIVRRPTWEDYINSLRTNKEYLLNIMARPKMEYWMGYKLVIDYIRNEEDSDEDYY